MHVPFCLSVCPYCDFVVYAGSSARGPRNLIRPFVEALRREIELRGRDADTAFGRDRFPLASVYIGGGTPSLLSAADVAGILDTIERAFGIAHDPEITLEANPGAADLGDLAGFRAAGVNRLSIGAQSLDAAELRTLGRRHTASDVARAVQAARGAGLDNVSFDLLYDIPGQTMRSWEATLRRVGDLDVAHVSAYALSLTLDGDDTLDGRLDRSDDAPDGRLARAVDHLPVTPGARRWRTKARAAQDEDRGADMYALAEELLSSFGFAWYEISNWARPDRGSRHNQAYWTGLSFEGVGPGAHAYDGGRERRWNGARLDRYISALNGPVPRLPPGGSEVVSSDVAESDGAMLALRTARGLDRAVLTRPSSRAALDWALQEGLLEESGDAVRLTLRGRLLGSVVFERLL